MDNGCSGSKDDDAESCTSHTYGEEDLDDDSDREERERPFIVPFVEYKRGTANTSLATYADANAPLYYNAIDMLKVKHVGNPMLLYGTAYIGKTSLIMKLLGKARDLHGPKHWVALIEMRQLRDIVKTLEKPPKSIFQLLAMELKTTEEDLKALFQIDKNSTRQRPIVGDLFLDGLDEIPAKERDYFWRIVPQLKFKEGECAVRIWISCRSYLKSALSRVFPELGYFEIIKLNTHQQVELLQAYWISEFFPDLKEDKFDHLWNYTWNLVAHLQKMAPGFDSALGAYPVFTEVIAGIFSFHACKYLKSGEKEQPLFSKYALTIPELMDNLIGSMIEHYCLKHNPNRKYDYKRTEQEFLRVAQLYAEYAVSTYPLYQYSPSAAISTSISKNGNNETVYVTGTLDRVQLSEDLFSVGFMTKDDDGFVRFQHHTFGDFFLGKYFTFKGTVGRGDIELDRFYLYKMLFEEEARPILTYYDCLLRFDSEYKPMLLREFILLHYKLKKCHDREWEKIRNNGNVWHLMVIQGFHNTARMFCNLFKPCETYELKKFLKMRAPLDILETNNIQLIDGKTATIHHNHLVSSLGMLALFGYYIFVEDTLRVFLQTFNGKELLDEFNNLDGWSPIHYASIHSNYWFFKPIYETEFHKKVRVDAASPIPLRGLLPVHLLMTCNWKHALKLKDQNLADYDLMFEMDPPNSPPSSGKGTQKGKSPRKSPKKNGGGGCKAGRGGGGAEKKGKGKKNQIDIDDSYRVLIRERGMQMDMQTYPALVETLHACIGALVRKGGADMNAFDAIKDITMLHCAVQDGLLDTVRFLVKLGVSVNLQNRDGMTPLHLAGLYGMKEIFMCLVKNGAKVNILDSRGLSPIVMWKKWGEKVYYAKGGQPLSEEDVHFFQCCTDLDKLIQDRKKEGQTPKKKPEVTNYVPSDSEQSSILQSQSEGEEEEDEVVHEEAEEEESESGSEEEPSNNP